MSNKASPIEIGSEVRVEVDLVKDRLPIALIDQLSKDPTGKVIEYKMTDGGGIGFVIEFSNGKCSWFFEEEIKLNQEVKEQKLIQNDKPSEKDIVKKNIELKLPGDGKKNIDIDMSQLSDQLPERLINTLKKDRKGKFIDYKMTDGGGIGIIVELNDGSKNWFFGDELSAREKSISLDKIAIGKSNRLMNRSNFKEPDINSEIKELLNPMNFIKWLLYSVKDIV